MTAPTEREQRYADVIRAAIRDDLPELDALARLDLEDDICHAVMAVADAEQAELRAENDRLLRRVACAELLLYDWTDMTHAQINTALHRGTA